MRYAAEDNDATRERILEAASRLFREQGFAAVGLAKIMAEADLTVGTFCTHFQVTLGAGPRSSFFGRLTLEGGADKGYTAACCARASSTR